MGGVAERGGRARGPAPTLETPRLRLRGWRESDLEPLAALHADPEVMRHLGGPIDRAKSDAVVEEMVGRIAEHFARHGFGWWALEVRESGALAGTVGLAVPRFEAPFMPCVEVGWRLARAHWGSGFATEGAREALRFGFESVGLDEIVSFTVTDNLRSRAVMERLGMRHRPEEDFAHPAFPVEHPLSRHVLYRLDRTAWASAVVSRRAAP